MLAALTLAKHGDTERTLWLYDTFDGMTEPEQVDIEHATKRPARELMAEQPREAGHGVWAIAGRTTVEANLSKTSYPSDLIHYVEGMVENTLEQTYPEQIAILRLDTDFYKSTMVELRALWPRLVSGGILIIDDYGYWEGARRAVDEFFGAMENPPFMSRIDVTGRVMVKP